VASVTKQFTLKEVQHLIRHVAGRKGRKFFLSFRYVQNKKPPWPQSASELYPPSDRRLSAKVVPAFADRGCHVVSTADPYSRILGFLDRSRYFFFQIAPQCTHEAERTKFQTHYFSENLVPPESNRSSGPVA
jgi:hypothetical protein